MTRPAAPLFLIAAFSLGLTACGDTGGAYPQLLPMDQVLTDPAPAADPVAVQAELHGDAGDLRARAARLRGPVIDPATRAQMAAMRARHR